jgi:hypothetical protein
MAATLTDLLSIRGQLADGLEAYLQSFVDLSAWATTPAFLLLPSGISQEIAALELYQPPDVINPRAPGCREESAAGRAG